MNNNMIVIYERYSIQMPLFIHDLWVWERWLVCLTENNTSMILEIYENRKFTLAWECIYYGNVINAILPFGLFIASIMTNIGINLY